MVVLLCTTKLAQSTSQYYCVLQSSHKHVPVLMCTTKLAQTTSQYYCVLQSLQKLLPSTTVYYKTCTKHFPVLLCTTNAQTCSSTTKLAQTRSSTTVYHKARTNYFPVLLCTTKLALEHVCAFVVHSSTGKCFVQVL